MKLHLVTMHGEKIDSDVYEVIIPAIDGEISVFPDHESLITVAKAGVVTVRYEKGHGVDKLEYFAISGGVVESSDNVVKILVDEAGSGGEIIEAETNAALERAIAMRDSAQDQVELEKAYQLVDTHRVKLRVAELHRRRRSGSR
ncbi:ATP synthase F1 subunit epsilon [Candidatus Saccharibacteria bacterium 32-49-10]|nr:MAG: ATP synthase F1 subunit epsilon [Candidatus Saccharibacteria bacterium 32-49-10]